MLGEQWLNRSAPTDMQGTATERSQDRQQKINGIDNWHFEYVMGPLPLMLQAALLLFGWGLRRYLWEVDVTAASVILCVTAFGVAFYIFIVVAGTASELPVSKTRIAHPPLSSLSYHINYINRRVSYINRYSSFWTCRKLL